MPAHTRVGIQGEWAGQHRFSRNALYLFGCLEYIIVCIYLFLLNVKGFQLSLHGSCSLTTRESLSNNPGRYSFGCAPVNMTIQAGEKCKLNKLVLKLVFFSCN